MDRDTARVWTQAMCKLTFYAPYWLDNRTGLDLVFTDHQSAPQSPLLLGARFPWEVTSVYCPGASSTPSLIPARPCTCMHRCTGRM